MIYAAKLYLKYHCPVTAPEATVSFLGSSTKAPLLPTQKHPGVCAAILSEGQETENFISITSCLQGVTGADAAANTQSPLTRTENTHDGQSQDVLF